MESANQFQSCDGYHADLFRALAEADPAVFELIRREFDRLRSTLQLIAAENLCSRAVLAALGSVVQNKTAEGFPQARYHGGCEVVDDIESLAIERAKKAFKALYANVQPHSGTQANQIVLTAILNAGDRILSLGMDQGGHPSHGANISWTGRLFNVENYCVDRQTFLLDYDVVRAKAITFRPKLIICGATVYSRVIDFERFRTIADEVGAYLLADVSHTAGLIIAGAHPSPVDHAHFTTTSTYKPGGPRGGLILMGRDFDKQLPGHGADQGAPLYKLIEEATFPGLQGTPYFNHIAAKAVFFKEALSQEYKERQFRIVENARALAAALLNLGHDVLTRGTDNYMVLVNVMGLREGLTGAIAQNCLEDCGIIVNMNNLPYDDKPALVGGGIRLGTPIVTRLGIKPAQMTDAAEMVDSVLRCVTVKDQRHYRIDESFVQKMRSRVKDLCDSLAMW